MDNLKNLLFIDLETASGAADFAGLETAMQQEWSRKALQRWRDESIDGPEYLYDRKAALYPEFGRITCISMGVLTENGTDWQLHVHSFAGADEKQILADFAHSLNRFSEKRGEPVLVGHNIREFGIPFIARRTLLQRLPLPAPLKLQGKKSWEIPHQDTLQLWQFGDSRTYIRLSLLCEILGIENTGKDLSGEQANRLFWQQKDFAALTRHSEQDVAAIAKAYFLLLEKPDVSDGLTVVLSSDKAAGKNAEANL